MITDAAGTIKEQRQFDAWGNILKLTDGAGNALTAFSIIDRGYTGHEHLLGVGLINMNGRLYDPLLHRFLSPDDYIQDPTNTQNFNRYGYVMNNPLKYTDESGQFWQIIIGAAISVVTNGINNLAHGDNFFKGAWKAAAIGALGGAFSYAIGNAAQTMTGIGKVAFQTAAHAYIGGMMSEMNGGSFGTGALSGAFGSLAAYGTSSLLSNANEVLMAGGTILSGAAIGGLSSEIEGGSFWDGARNGAISATLNHVAHMLEEEGGRNPKQDKPLTKEDIKNLEKQGFNHRDKSLNGKNGGKLDLYKDRDGNVYEKPKGGTGAGEPIGYNLNHYSSYQPIMQRSSTIMSPKPIMPLFLPSPPPIIMPTIMFEPAPITNFELIFP